MALKWQDSRIVMFAKRPQIGRVKTRLQTVLTAAQALAVYQQLFHHTLRTLVSAKLAPVELWFDEPADEQLKEQVRQRHGAVEIKVQQGKDLGQRMQHAVDDVLARAEKIVLVGADCPGIDKDYLFDALQAMQRGIPVVLGPASDGGYVLLATQQANLHIFEAILWGQREVLSQTRERLKRQEIKWHELPELTDIDRPEDLVVARRYGIAVPRHAANL